ncbi:hypothetical protein BRADI_4g42198v3 [Brachypodium distachyon]|uniref:KIB1-4 beta-propeller domain-containing protein n=1 Tax=Brachypodium distachyon TaxID=15368 RepID=A0A2K2CTR9_BRADI|nr:hypothetical protein BRADI_4g42198v3 [Brachypodium distachyon]
MHPSAEPIDLIMSGSPPRAAPPPPPAIPTEAVSPGSRVFLALVTRPPAGPRGSLPADHERQSTNPCRSRSRCAAAAARHGDRSSCTLFTPLVRRPPAGVRGPRDPPAAVPRRPYPLRRRLPPLGPRRAAAGADAARAPPLDQQLLHPSLPKLPRRRTARAATALPVPGMPRLIGELVDVREARELRPIQFIVCSDDDLIVLMARGCPYPPPLGPLIACCRPGSMSSWSTATYVAQESDYDFHYQDIAFHHGNVYGVNGTGDLYAHNISEDSGTGEMVVSHAKQVIKCSDAWFGMKLRQFFLAVSRGDLLLVKWIDDEMFTSSFEVFKVDLEMSRWSEVSSLGDQVLFVSGMCSKAVSTSSDGDYLRGNCIYFMDYDRRGAKGCAMYDLRDNTYHKIHTPQCRSHEPAWFFPHK